MSCIDAIHDILSLWGCQTFDEAQLQGQLCVGRGERVSDSLVLRLCLNDEGYVL